MSPDPREGDAAAEAIAGHLMEHPGAQTAVDRLATRVRETVGTDMRMMLIDPGDEMPGTEVDDIFCTDSLNHPTVAWVVKPDGTTKQVLR